MRWPVRYYQRHFYACTRGLEPEPLTILVQAETADAAAMGAWEAIAEDSGGRLPLAGEVLRVGAHRYRFIEVGESANDDATAQPLSADTAP